MAERKVLLVCWQGAEQKEIDHLLKEGKLPQLQRAINEGSSGNLFGFPPRDPTIDWATLTTGVCSHDHGVLSPAFFDSNLKKAVPAPNSIRKFPAFWNLLSQQSLATHVIGGPLSYPAEQISGIYLSQKLIDDLQTRTINAEICEDLILPVEWNEHLQDLKVTADSLDPRLLEFFLTSSEEIPKSRDFRWKTIVYRLAELYTAHNFAIHLLHSEVNCNCLTICYPIIERLFYDFGQFCRLSSKNSGYGDRVYGDVVTAAYRVLDILLSDLLQQSGPGTTLFFVSNSRSENSNFGIRNPLGKLIVAGPGIEAKKQINGAKSIDLVPTLLHAFDLPVGEEMEGRVLDETFREKRKPETISSWRQKAESGFRGNGRNDSVSADSGFESNSGSENVLENVRDRIQREIQFNQGLSLLSADRADEALPFLCRAAADRPENRICSLLLAQALSNLRLFEEAVEAVTLLTDDGETAETVELKIQIALENQNFSAVREFLKAAENLESKSERLDGYRGFLFLIENRFPDAEICFRRMVSKNEKNPFGWAGLSRSLLGLEKKSEAFEAAEKGAALLSENHLVQLAFAQAAEAVGKTEVAALAHADALRLVPNLAASRDGLLRLALTVSRETEAEIFNRIARRKKSEMKLPVQRISKIAFQNLRENLRNQRIEIRKKSEPLFGYDFGADRILASRFPEIFKLVRIDDVQLRFPWPDELQRVLDFIGDPDVCRGEVFPLLVHPVGSDRIVAAGILQKSNPKGDEGRIFLSIRGKQNKVSLLAAMIGKLEKLAQHLKIQKLIAVLPETILWRKELFRFGFEHVYTDEYLQLPVRTPQFKRKIEAAARSAKWVENRTDLKIRPFDCKKDLQEANEILKAYRFADLDQSEAARYSSELSYVVCDKEKIAGLILAKDYGETVFIHARAVAPSFANRSKAINALLIERSVYRVFRDSAFRNVEHLLFTGRPEDNQDTRLVSETSGGRRLKAFSVYEKRF